MVRRGALDGRSIELAVSTVRCCLHLCLPQPALDHENDSSVVPVGRVADNDLWYPWATRNPQAVAGISCYVRTSDAAHKVHIANGGGPYPYMC